MGKGSLSLADTSLKRERDAARHVATTGGAPRGDGHPPQVSSQPPSGYGSPSPSQAWQSLGRADASQIPEGGVHQDRTRNAQRGASGTGDEVQPRLLQSTWGNGPPTQSSSGGATADFILPPPPPPPSSGRIPPSHIGSVPPSEVGGSLLSHYPAQTLPVPVGIDDYNTITQLETVQESVPVTPPN